MSQDNNNSGFHEEDTDILDHQDRVGDKTADQFKSEFTGPVNTSIPQPQESQQQAAEEPKGFFSFSRPADVHVEDPPEVTEPLFADDPEEPQAQQAPAPLSDKARHARVRSYVRLEEMAKSSLLMAITGADSRNPFKYSDEDREELIEIFEPLIGDLNLSPWIIGLSAYVTANGPVIAAARQHLKAKNARKRIEAQNAQLRNSPAVKQAVQQRAETEGEGVRTRYQIGADGYYFYDRFGNYYAEGEPRELASLADIAKIIANKSNTAAKIKKVFNLSDEDYNNMKGSE